MKFLSICLIILFSGNVTWLGNFGTAKTEAAKQHKLILINFSGSDWCGPCILLRKEILEAPVFESYAASHLVLVRADFPREKKNQLSKEQEALNDALANQFNADGKFPYTLLVDENGKVLKSWDGLPKESPEKFVTEIAKVSGSFKK